MTEKEIKQKLSANEISPEEDLSGKLFVYFSLLCEWNKKMDLTAADREDEIIDKHFIDSLSVLKCGLIRPKSVLIDVGTGAGFPGLVLALARKDLSVTLLDALQKRVRFLEAVAEATGAKNVTLIHGRAEDIARRKDFREQFDIAAARAVAPLNTLCELLLPFVKKGGRAICWKGPALEQELEEGQKSAATLGGRIESAICCSIFGQDWDHRILPILKTEKTPARYPRKAGTPKSDPLGR